jgi:hypothetical protein
MISVNKKESKMSKGMIPNVPYVFQGLVPRCHVTSLIMILEYYGLKYSQSFLMNLSGFNYGFVYFKGKNMAFGNPESPFGPWPFMAYAAEKIGCKVDLLKDKPWDETWTIMKQHVDKGIPICLPMLNMKPLWKTMAPVPHLMVLCGYDEEKSIVMTHDPALGELGEGILRLGSNQLPAGKSGSYAEYTIEDFKQACDLKGTPWEVFGKNGLCVMQPAKKPSISLGEVLERSSKLTFGQVEQVIGKNIPSEYVPGPEGIIELAEDLETGFGLLKEATQLSEVLLGLRNSAFLIGSSYKTDASAFLAGLALVRTSHALEIASYNFRLSALCYEKGLAVIDSSSKIERKLSRISRLLKRIAQYEKKAGKSLSEGAKSESSRSRIC